MKHVVTLVYFWKVEWLFLLFQGHLIAPLSFHPLPPMSHLLVCTNGFSYIFSCISPVSCHVIPCCFRCLPWFSPWNGNKTPHTFGSDLSIPSFSCWNAVVPAPPSTSWRCILCVVSHCMWHDCGYFSLRDLAFLSLLNTDQDVSRCYSAMDGRHTPQSRRATPDREVQQ